MAAHSLFTKFPNGTALVRSLERTARRSVFNQKNSSQLAAGCPLLSLCDTFPVPGIDFRIRLDIRNIFNYIAFVKPKKGG